jgi:glucose-6-phosphate dehydrogenase assembly protein OpcA
MQVSTETFQALENSVGQLPIAERLMLIDVITRSLRVELGKPIEATSLNTEARRILVDRLRGCLHQTDQAALTDEAVDRLLEQRRIERYL